MLFLEKAFINHYRFHLTHSREYSSIWILLVSYFGKLYLFFRSILHFLQLFYTYKLQFILLFHADPLTKVVENCLSKARNWKKFGRMYSAVQ